MREKLIKLLYQAPCESDLEGELGSCPYRKYGRCGEVDRLDYCAVQLLADHLIANGVVISNSEKTTKWIPVTERLPTIEDATEKGAILAWEVSVKHWDIWAWDCVRDYPDRFIGWMPLPEPPKGD